MGCGARSSLADADGAGGAGGGARGAPPPCTQAEEVCNGIDDDCDGAVDEGLAFARRSGPHTVDSALSLLAQGDLVATDTGFLAAYSTSFDGSNPTPNVRYAILGPDGAPLTEPANLTDRNMTNGLRLTAAPTGFFASYCGRFDAGDRAAAGFVTIQGGFEELGALPIGFCGAGTPDAVWTGQRFLYTYAESSSNEGVVLSRADENGVWQSSETVASNDTLSHYPRLAQSGDVTFFIYGAVNGEPEIRLHALDAFGDDFIDGPIVTYFEVGNVGDVAVVSQGGGRIALFRLVVGETISHQALSYDPGTGSTASAGVDYAELAGATSMRVVADPAGGAVIAGTKGFGAPLGFAARVDAEGNLTAYYETSQDPEAAGRVFDFPMVAVRSGSVVVGYTNLAVPDTPVFETIELGCDAAP